MCAFQIQVLRVVSRGHIVKVKADFTLDDYYQLPDGKALTRKLQLALCPMIGVV